MLAGLLLATTAPAAAQRLADLEAGTPLRVHLVGPPRVTVNAPFAGADSTRIILRSRESRAPDGGIHESDDGATRGTDGRATVTFELAEVRRIEARISRRSAGSALFHGARRGAIIGLGVTAALVAVGGVSDLTSDCRDYCFPSSLVGLGAGTVVTLLTTTTGAAIGLARRDRWRTVYRMPKELPRTVRRATASGLTTCCSRQGRPASGCVPASGIAPVQIPVPA